MRAFQDEAKRGLEGSKGRDDGAGEDVLTFEDLLAAKVAIQLGVLTPDVARSSLKAALASGRTLAQELEAARTVDSPTARTIAGHARRCSFLKAESTYVASLRKRGAIDEAALERARQAQYQEGLRQRLGERLIRDGAITQAVDQAVLAEARQTYTNDNAQVTERYVQRGFEDIERYSATVAEVLGQLAKAPTEVKPPPINMATPATGVLLPPRATRPVPPMPPRPPVGAPDPAGDLVKLGHSQEGTNPALRVARPAAAVSVAPAPVQPIPVAAPAAPSPLAGTGLEERYDVVKKVGEGGMGAVYLAKEIETGRDVALKVVLDREKSQEAAMRFKREILATSMCDHENIIQIYDAGPTKDGSYFMAMEFVRGEELADTIKREGAIAIPRFLDLFEQVLEGIGAVHSAGIVHRDLKPQNFRIWKDEAGKEHVKIMDFGIARMKDQDGQFADQFYRTMGGKITGSPAYIAPESITEPDVDNRADLYSLGVAMFRTVTGRLPFTCKDPMEYLPKHLYEQPPVPSQFTPDKKIPKALDEVILKALAKPLSQRYQTADEILRDLRERVRPVVKTKADTSKIATMNYDANAIGMVLESPDSSPAGPGEVTIKEAPPTPEQLAGVMPGIPVENPDSGSAGAQTIFEPPPGEAAPSPNASGKTSKSGATKGTSAKASTGKTKAPAPTVEMPAAEEEPADDGKAKPLANRSSAASRYAQAEAEKGGGCLGLFGKKK